MLTLDHYITLNEAAIKSPNLCDRFGEDDLKRIGMAVVDGYKRDKDSRRKWEERNEAGMDLALQIQKAKLFPWPNASNVAFPLVTIAAMQFHARAYPAIISGSRIAEYRVTGADPNGVETQRAQRISDHMSWQVLEQDQAWEEQHDRGLLNLAIVGTNFIKTRFSAADGHNVSELVLARDLVVDYWAKSVESAPRKTQRIPLYRNDIYTKAKRGTFRKGVLDETWFAQAPSNNTNDQHKPKQDNRAGVVAPQTDETTPFPGLEQHVQMDLDDDGYAEPYIITVEETTGYVLRIVSGADREEDVERDGNTIISVTPQYYFTKYSFIPSPDGGLYDIGFGVLLGPLNESVNGLINQLVDAGTMANTAGGFLGRGAKIRGGNYSFSPLEWKRVDSSADDLAKSIFPLPVREPSSVLFQLLGLLIDYTNRVSGANDMMVGENPGQNTPAETSRAMIEQGSKIYSAIFKRVWRSLKEEFKKLYVLNAIYLPERSTFGPAQSISLQEDYLGNPNSIAPSADPNITSEGQRLVQAQAVKAAAQTTPGYDVGAAERFYLAALKVPGADAIYPGPENVPQGKDPKLAIAEMKAQTEMAKLQSAQAQFAAELMETQRMNSALIAKIEGELLLAQASVQGDEVDREINRMNTMLGLMKAQQSTLTEKINTALKAAALDVQQRENAADRELEREKLAKQGEKKE